METAAISKLPAHIASKIEVDMLSGCWVWRGRLDADGYGVTSLDGKSRLFHRAVRETLVGPIPEGCVCDHLLADREIDPGPCVHGRPCGNPSHNEPVSVALNTKRVRNWHRAKTHCPAGHRYLDLFDDETGELLDAGHGSVYTCADGATRRFCDTCRKFRRDAEKRTKKRSDA